MSRETVSKFRQAKIDRGECYSCERKVDFRHDGKAYRHCAKCRRTFREYARKLYAAITGRTRVVRVGKNGKPTKGRPRIK